MARPALHVYRRWPPLMMIDDRSVSECGVVDGVEPGPQTGPSQAAPDAQYLYKHPLFEGDDSSRRSAWSTAQTGMTTSQRTSGCGIQRTTRTYSSATPAIGGTHSKTKRFPMCTLGRMETLIVSSATSPLSAVARLSSPYATAATGRSTGTTTRVLITLFSSLQQVELRTFALVLHV